MTTSHLIDKNITFSMNNPNFQRNLYVKLTGEGLSGTIKKPGTFLVVVSTGDTRIG